MEILSNFDVYITELMNNLSIFAPLVACLLICVESILPLLPLALFITVNFYYFGPLLGFFISWTMTCIGCYIAFKIFRLKVKLWFDSKYIIKNDLKLTKWMMIVDNLSLEKLVLLMVIPFSPAFMINIVAGVSSMSEKKFVTALIIGKIFLVFFWGFIGTSLIESVKQPHNLIVIIVLMIIAFFTSKIVHKKYGIN